MAHSLLRTAVAAAACLAVTASSAYAQMSSAMSAPDTMRKPVMALICPPTVTVTMAPTAPVPGGWSANTDPFKVTLDPLNLPRIGMHTMSCYYALGNQPGSFVIYQSEGSRTCTVRADKKGFDCM